MTSLKTRFLRLSEDKMLFLIAVSLYFRFTNVLVMKHELFMLHMKNINKSITVSKQAGAELGSTLVRLVKLI